MKFAVALLLLLSAHLVNDLWIGGQYVTNGGYWEWTPSGERIDDGSLNWVEVEPSRLGWGHCLVLAPGVTTLQWNETPCDANITFVCQKPALENNRTQLEKDRINESSLAN